MIKSSNGNYIYLVVPAKYECIYINLIKEMSNLGIDIIKDCASCEDNKHLLDAWNMFQSACIAYNENREIDADEIIIYINSILNFNCDISSYNDKYIYYGNSIEYPKIEDIIKNNKIKRDYTKDILSPFFKTMNYIAVPKGTNIVSIENATFRGDYLYKPDSGINLYKIYNISINNEPYLLYVCELLAPLNSNVIIKTKEEDWSSSDIIYYGTGINKPIVEDVILSNIFNPNMDNELIFHCDNIGHYLAIPNNRVISYIRSVNSTLDWLYNKTLNINVYDVDIIDINGKGYTLYYYDSIIPINGDIKLVMK